MISNRMNTDWEGYVKKLKIIESQSVIIHDPESRQIPAISDIFPSEN